MVLRPRRRGQGGRVDSSRRACEQLGEKGYRYVYREIDGADHGGILRYPDVADDPAFIHSLRHKEIPLSKDERTELSSLSNKVKNEKAENVGPMIGKPQRSAARRGAGDQQAVDNADPEVKSGRDDDRDVLYGRETMLELVKLLRDKSER